MKQRKGIIDRLFDTSAWSETPYPGQTLLEIVDDRRILIEHHGGVTEYTCTQIQVNVSYGSVCILGSELRVSKMSAEQLVITGNVSSVTLIRER